MRLCFLAYWLSDRLGRVWRAESETEEVPRVLRHLRSIRLGRLQMEPNVHHTTITKVQNDLNEQLQRNWAWPAARLAAQALDVARPNRENLGFTWLFLQIGRKSGYSRAFLRDVSYELGAKRRWWRVAALGCSLSSSLRSSINTLGVWQERILAEGLV